MGGGLNRLLWFANTFTTRRKQLLKHHLNENRKANSTAPVFPCTSGHAGTFHDRSRAIISVWFHCVLITYYLGNVDKESICSNPSSTSSRQCDHYISWDNLVFINRCFVSFGRKQKRKNVPCPLETTGAFTFCNKAIWCFTRSDSSDTVH